MKKLLLLMLSLIITGSAFADLTVTSKNNDGVVETQFFKKELAATYTNGKVDTIVDLNKMTITVIMHDNQSYTIMTKEDMETAIKKAKEAMDKALTDPRTAAYFNTLKERAENMKVKVTKGGTREVSGYSCQDYMIKVENEDSSSMMCLSEELMKRIKSEFDYEKMKSLFDKGMSNPMAFESKLDTTMNDLQEKGYPLIEEINTKGNMDGVGGVADTTTVIKVTSNKIDPAMFSVPKGYKKVNMLDMMQ